MKKVKCYSVVVFIGIVTSYKLSFKEYPSLEDIKTALDDKLEAWNITNGEQLILESSINNNNLYVNTIKAEFTFSEDFFYDNGSSWTAVNSSAPEEGQEVMITFKNLAGVQVGEATYNKGVFYYIAETDNGCFEEPYDNVVAWMAMPTPYSMEE